jgi:hypothetical protein
MFILTMVGGFAALITFAGILLGWKPSEYWRLFIVAATLSLCLVFLYLASELLLMVFYKVEILSDEGYERASKVVNFFSRTMLRRLLYPGSGWIDARLVNDSIRIFQLSVILYFWAPLVCVLVLRIIGILFRRLRVSGALYLG